MLPKRKYEIYRPTISSRNCNYGVNNSPSLDIKGADNAKLTVEDHVKYLCLKTLLTVIHCLFQ